MNRTQLRCAAVATAIFLGGSHICGQGPPQQPGRLRGTVVFQAENSTWKPDVGAKIWILPGTLQVAEKELRVVAGRPTEKLQRRISVGKKKQWTDVMPVATAVSDGAGNYEFTGLLAGDYCVLVVSGNLHNMFGQSERQMDSVIIQPAADSVESFRIGQMSGGKHRCGQNDPQ